MKRKDLIKLFERNGWVLEREGGSHTVYTDGKDHEAIPRHNEVNERLAKALIKKHNLK